MNAEYRKIENAGPAGLLSQRFYTPGALTVTDKDQVSSVTLCSVTSVRSAGSYGGFRAFQSGVKIEGVISHLRLSSPRAYYHKKIIGVILDTEDLQAILL